MKQIILSFTVLAFVLAVVPSTAEARCSYQGYLSSGGKCAKSWQKKNNYEYRYHFEKRDDKSNYQYEYRSAYRWSIDSEDDLEEYIDYLLRLIEDLRDRQRDLEDNDRDDDPTATTRSAREVEDDEAELRGLVAMNDFNNGRVFFIYGEDEDQVDDAREEDRYSDIDEDGDDLQKTTVDNDLDDRSSYTKRVTGLDDDTEHYFSICVEYEDEEDETLECGAVRNFETD